MIPPSTEKALLHQPHKDKILKAVSQDASLASWLLLSQSPHDVRFKKVFQQAILSKKKKHNALEEVLKAYDIIGNF